jgi:hypothetical protein
MDDRLMQQECLIHVRYEGRSWDLVAAQFGVSPGSSDVEVREAVARYLEVPVVKLAVYVVERYANGNITLRPQAVFG